MSTIEAWLWTALILWAMWAIPASVYRWGLLCLVVIPIVGLVLLVALA